MREAAMPSRETERLEALRGLEILDTLPEQAYDDITFIASRLCTAPIALMSLVDADRQWFKSRVGLDAEETPRAMAFCSHAILEPEEVFEVQDTHRDQRFVDNPLVTGAPRIRFYAGAPLVTSDGHALGTLCVIDREPRRLSAAERAALRSLARQVVAQLELRRAHRRLEAQSHQLAKSRDELAGLCHVLEGQLDAIERDLRRAETIQRSLLPQETPHMPGFRVRSLYRPGQTIGGDLYDVQNVSERHVALVVADAAGHGVSAAMLSLLFKHRLRLVDENGGGPLGPGEALARINEALVVDLPAPGIFVTATYGLLDTHHGTLRLASAGHPPALLLRGDGATEPLARTGPALGLYGGVRYDERTVELDEGDRLLLYTDGLFGGENESPSRLREIAERVRAADDGSEVLEALIEDLARGGAEPERDDVTLLLVEAGTGESHFAKAPAPGPAGAAANLIAPVTFAVAPEGTYLALRGRVTWLHGSTLLAAASDALDTRRPLRFDLRACDYLDSTLLGTLHEIATRADAAGVAVTLHGTSPELYQALQELDMHALLDRVSPDPIEEPRGARPLAQGAPDIRTQQRRLLRAHEVLAELSERNRAEFADVVQGVREELLRSERRS